MNIKQAKQEIINTVRAYLAKDEAGEYLIPVERQRPVLLIGPPGIGKTAIMEQAARALGVNLVAYTITHHTRQSAIGLPFIEKKTYGGKEVSVTEYTMSEIIASIYDQIESSGIREGILFLDEINCVSETLAPTMLQFLQYKTFGNHRVPDGFVIVTAGNPPQYNKSVRDFDIVTYDRVKRIYVEEDFSVWKEYAYQMRINGAILSYLEIKKKHFYSVVSDLDGKRFVTARGWEDLSQIMRAYERLSLPIDYELIVQYVQDAEIARDFADYYALYQRYRDVYRVPEILDGTLLETPELKNVPFDEKLSLLGLLLEQLGQQFAAYVHQKDVQKALQEQLGFLLKDLKAEKGSAAELLLVQAEGYAAILKREQAARLLTPDAERVRKETLSVLQECRTEAAKQPGTPREEFAVIHALFDAREKKRQEHAALTGQQLTNAFSFLVRTFGEGQELVLFLSELSASVYAVTFVGEHGNEAYYKYSKLLLLKERGQQLKEEVMELMNFFDDKNS